MLSAEDKITAIIILILPVTSELTFGRNLGYACYLAKENACFQNCFGTLYCQHGFAVSNLATFPRLGTHKLEHIWLSGFQCYLESWILRALIFFNSILIIIHQHHSVFVLHFFLCDPISWEIPEQYFFFPLALSHHCFCSKPRIIYLLLDKNSSCNQQFP